MTRRVFILFLFIITGAIIGIMLIRKEQRSIQNADARHDSGPAQIVGETPLPDAPPSTLNESQELLPESEMDNSIPVVLGTIITGIQNPTVGAVPMNEDQIILERNVIRDFGQLLDPEIRNPDSIGNQRAKEQMVRMVLSRNQPDVLK